MDSKTISCVKSAFDYLSECAYKLRCHEAGFIRDQEWIEFQSELKKAYSQSPYLRTLVDREVGRTTPSFNPELLSLFVKD